MLWIVMAKIILVLTFTLIVLFNIGKVAILKILKFILIGGLLVLTILEIAIATILVIQIIELFIAIILLCYFIIMILTN